MGRRKKQPEVQPEIELTGGHGGDLSEVLTGSLPGPSQTETQVKPYEIGTLSELKAKSFANLIKEKGVIEAAKLVGEKQWLQFTSREEVREQVTRIIQRHHLPPEARKMLVRSGFNQLAIEGLASKDPADKKVALDALKNIAADTEVGITQPAAMQVSIDLSVLKDVMATSSLPDIELDGEIVNEGL